MNLLNLSTLYPGEASYNANWKERRDSRDVECSEWQFGWLLTASVSCKNEFRHHIRQSFICHKNYLYPR